MKPEIRASLLRLYLERLPACGQAEAAAARAALGADAVRRIERAPGYEWLPLAWEAAILRAVHAVSGDEGIGALGRDIGRVAGGTAILRPLVSAVLGMLGRRPEALLQLAVAGMPVGFRNVGRVAIVSRRSGEVRIAYDGIPEAARDRVLLLRMSTTAEGLLRSSGVDGTVAVEWTEGAPSAVLVASWTRRG